MALRRFSLSYSMFLLNLANQNLPGSSCNRKKALCSFPRYRFLSSNEYWDPTRPNRWNVRLGELVNILCHQGSPHMHDTKSAKLFALPIETKMKAPHPPEGWKHRGYSGVGHVRLAFKLTVTFQRLAASRYHSLFLIPRRYKPFVLENFRTLRNRSTRETNNPLASKTYGSPRLTFQTFVLTLSTFTTHAASFK